MRCLTLADELLRRGARVRFVCRRYPGNLIGRIEAAGIAVHALAAPAGREHENGDAYGVTPAKREFADAAETHAAIGSATPDWLVVDQYDLGRGWETAMRPFAGRILAIDDVNRSHDCDLLLDQNWVGIGAARRYADLVPGTCQRLLGPRYALLRPEYAKLRRSLRTRDGKIRHVLVSFGGVDASNETGKALAALSRPEFAALGVDVVIGQHHAASKQVLAACALRRGTAVHRDLPSLADLMARADYSLGAAGTTAWERLCLDLPSAVVAVADNQLAAARALAEAGYVRWLGVPAQTVADDYAKAVAQAVRPPGDLPALVDGLGTVRCADAMHGA